MRTVYPVKRQLSSTHLIYCFLCFDICFDDDTCDDLNLLSIRVTFRSTCFVFSISIMFDISCESPDSRAISNFVFKIWSVSLGISCLSSRVHRHTLYCSSSKLRKLRGRFEKKICQYYVCVVTHTFVSSCFDCDVIKQNIQDTF